MRQHSVLITHPGADLYGSDRVMLETVRGLHEQGWDVTVSLPASGPLVTEVEQSGGRVTYCPAPVLRKSALRPVGMIKMIGEGLRSLPPSIRLIRATRPDLVYVSTLTIPLWLLLAKLLRRPVVCHVHESERTSGRLLQRILALPLLFADALVVNSEFSRNVLLDSFPSLSGKSEVIYNGVPGPEMVTPAREALTGPTRLLFIGRLSPRKGPQLAIKLVSLLELDDVPVELHVVGAVYPGYEWFEQELRAQVSEAGIGHQVIFHGFQDDVWPHIAAADVVLVPSQDDETFCNTAVEAVLAARPVVTSASSGLDEAVSGFACAQQVTADSLAEWAGAIRDVVKRWRRYRDFALVDAQTAKDRYAPTLYRSLITESLARLARR